MVKKKFDNKNILYLVIGILIALVLIKPGTTIIERTIIQNNTIIERLNEDPFPTLTCKLTSDQDRLIEGQTATGRIKAGSLTDCDIYADYNGLGWTKIAEGTTSFSGLIELSETLSLVGTWEFAAICGECTTNQIEIIVYSKTGDYDGDGSTNEEEIDQGTNPFDPDDYPDVQNGDVDDCDAICISHGYISGRGPFDSLGWCIYPEDYIVIPSPSSAKGCCCLPQEEDPEPEPDITTYTCGGETYGTCPPSHPNCEKVWYGLYEWAYTCTDVNQNIHNAWKPDGVNYDLQDDTPPIDHFCTYYDGGNNGIWGPGYCVDAYGTHYNNCEDINQINEYHCKYQFETGDNTCRVSTLSCDAYSSGGVSAHCEAAVSPTGEMSAICSW